MAKQRKTVTKIEQLLSTFIPLEEREWYPYVWPTAEEFDAFNPREFQNFIDKLTELAVNDFFFFCDEIMRSSDDPHLQPGLHDVLCHVLQNSDCDIGQLLPRNHLKSTISSVAYPIWRLGQDNNLRIMIASDTLKVAKSFLKAIRTHILENKYLHFVFPTLLPKEDESRGRYATWSSTEIEVERSKIGLTQPSVTVMSVGQDMAGAHFDIMNYDDIVTEKSIKAEGGVEKINEWYEGTISYSDRDTRIHIIGTRYRDNDLYGRLIEENEIPFYVRKHREKGKYIWDEPLSIDRVKKMKKMLSPHVFAAQYDNDPIVKGDAEFQPEWIKKWDETLLREVLVQNPPDRYDDLLEVWYKTLNIHMGCDPGRSEKKRSDYTVILVKGVDVNGREYALDYYRGRIKNHQIVEVFIEWLEKWNPLTAKVETFGGDIHVYNDIIKEMKGRGMPTFRVKEYEKNMRMSGEDRIRILQTPYANGMMYIGDSEKFYEYENELLRFPFGHHDDIITTDAYMHDQQIKPKRTKKKEVHIDVWQQRQCGPVNSRLERRRSGSWMTRGIGNG